MGAQATAARVESRHMTIVDSDILIDVALRIDEAVASLARIEEQAQLAVSVITQMELMVGCRNKAELRSIERFLQRFRVIKLSEAISDVALELIREYRLSHGPLIPDALIAATSLALQQPLISRNQRDYRFIRGLELLPYPGLESQKRD